MHRFVLLSVLSVGCASPEVPQFVPDEGVSAEREATAGRLHGVRVKAKLLDFSANTRDGHGIAGASEGRFFFDVRGLGKGVVMNAIIVERDVRDLAVGMVIDGGEPLVGCGGPVEDDWDIDAGTYDVHLEVIDETEDLWVIEYRGDFEHEVALDEHLGSMRGIVAVPRDLSH